MENSEPLVKKFADGIFIFKTENGNIEREVVICQQLRKKKKIQSEECH